MKTILKPAMRVAAFLLVLSMAVFLAGHYLMPTSNRYLKATRPAVSWARILTPSMYWFSAIPTPRRGLPHAVV